MTLVRPLSWGRRYLMCRPEHFRVDYAINPWMDVDPLSGNPDMVYAMNYGFVDGDHVAISSFRHDERRPEAEAAEWWFGELGYRTSRIADAGRGAFEAGDAFLVGDRLLVASGPRTDRTTHQVLADVFDVRVANVGVIHPALYHLDLSFCPLDETRAIVAPSAWDDAGWRTVRALVPEPLVISEREAFTFCANSVVVDDVVVMPTGVPPRVARQLERWGFAVETVDVSELHKAGGSIRCMTLPLDTSLDAARVTTRTGALGTAALAG